jgi:uncharacterized delta-60 repeat protein
VVLGCVLVSATALAATASAAPAPGELDPSFGVAGIVTGDNYVTEGWATMAVGPEDETFVLAPNAANCQPTELCKTVTLNLARYGRDGARDPIFGGASQLVVRQNQYQHSALAVGPEGKPVVAALDERSVLVARFGRDGLLDPGFGSGGIANASLTETRGTAPIVAVQADGRVLVAYEASEGSATEGRLVLTRFLANGNPDLSFGKGGTVTVTAALTRPAGLAFRGGGGFDVGLSQCCRGEGGSALTVGVDRFLPDGSLDPSLTSGGQGLVPRGTPSLLEAIAAAQGGRVYIAVNEERRGAMLLRLLPNGAPDPGFGKGGEVHLGVVVGVSTNVSQIAADSAGRVVGVAGYYGGGSNIFRLRSNGAPDLTFGAGRAVRLPAAGTNVSSTGFGFQSSGRIVMIVESGGSGVRAYKLARLFAGDSRVRCLGKRATIVGTAAAEKIVGTPGRDVIAALGGADQVRALGGNDLICGGKGRDSLFGGGGRDKIRQ